jgi:hypothetical protein
MYQGELKHCQNHGGQNTVTAVVHYIFKDSIEDTWIIR